VVARVMKSSMCSIVERRHLLKSFGFALICLASVPILSFSTAVQSKAAEALYAAIIVDVAPIKATGLAELANPIGAAVKKALNRTYRGLLNGKNASLPVLVVEVETLYYGQEEETFISKFSPRLTRTLDQMTGTAIVRKGKSERTRVSVLGNNSTPGGWPLVDDVESGRLQALADRFADAVRAELGD